MAEETIKIFPLGDSALTVEFGTTISPDHNRKAIALAEHFHQNPFDGFIEAVPAYASTTIFYDCVEVRRSSRSTNAFEAVRINVENSTNEISEISSVEDRVVEIPVLFDLEGEFDLVEVAARAGLEAAEVIEIFTAAAYRVYMLGFLPGFTYMGEVDERIATPRKETPRKLVPAGSVGIAGRQTGIYSLDSPGGWQIIGRTDVPLFTPAAERPTLLQAGDTVKFTVAE